MDVIALETPENTIKYTAPHIDDPEPFIFTEYGRTKKGVPCYQLRMASHVACLQYVVSGSGVIICDDKIYTVGTGDTFLLREGTDQIYYSNPDNHFERIWLNFKGQLAGSLLSVYGLGRRVVFHGCDTEQLLISVHERLREADPEEYHGLCAQLFLKIVQTLSRSRESERLAPSSVEQIRLYLDLHIAENIKLSEVAKSLSFSKEHIIRLFRQTYGITPHQYIIQSKMRIAMIQLQATDNTVEQISESLSFSDPHHFSAQFQKYVGERPSAYRARMKELGK